MHKQQAFLRFFLALSLSLSLSLQNTTMTAICISFMRIRCSLIVLTRRISAFSFHVYYHIHMKFNSNQNVSRSDFVLHTQKKKVTMMTIVMTLKRHMKQPCCVDDEKYFGFSTVSHAFWWIFNMIQTVRASETVTAIPTESLIFSAEQLKSDLFLVLLFLLCSCRVVVFDYVWFLSLNFFLYIFTIRIGVESCFVTLKQNNNRVWNFCLFWPFIISRFFLFVQPYFICQIHLCSMCEMFSHKIYI